MTARVNLPALLAQEAGRHRQAQTPVPTGIGAIEKKEGFTPEGEPVDLVSFLQGYLETAPPCSLLTVREACALLRISRSTLYLKIKKSPQNKHYDPEFPRPISYSDSGTGVFLSERELVVWMLSRAIKRKEVQ